MLTSTFFPLLVLCRLEQFKKKVQDAPIVIINGGAFHNLSRVAIADFYWRLVRTVEFTNSVPQNSEAGGTLVWVIIRLFHGNLRVFRGHGGAR